MAHYDIFREQLAIRFPALGHALWEPSPGNLYHVVRVGDVGHINEGRFHRLFNILLPVDDPSHRNFGVPDNHKPFQPKVLEHVISGILRPDNFCSAGVTLDSDGLGQYASRPRDPGEVFFSCRGKQGAVLSLPVQAKSENTVVRKDFGKWMIEHIDQWFAWTQHKGLEIDRMEDIILVTGADRTGSWANVAFLGGQADARVSFSVEVVRSRVNWQFSSERKTGAIWNWGPSGENLPEDQCIFIRGFRVARKRLILRSRLRAASGPNPDPKDEDFKPDVELISIPTVPKYRDPLHVILEYIAEERPNCDMTIVHDDDLRLLVGNGASLESLRPDVVLSRLRSSKPMIHDGLLGPALSSSNRGANGDTEIVRVASLSANFEGQLLRVSDSKGYHRLATSYLQTPIVTSEPPTTGTMSSPLSAPTSSMYIEQMPESALSEYKKETRKDLYSWPGKVPHRLGSVPTCLIPGCREPVIRDLRTNELTEYCGEAHMSEALMNHGIRVCSACNKFPRHTGSEYCGISCERWAAEQHEWRQRHQQQQQQQRHEREWQQLPHEPQQRRESEWQQRQQQRHERERLQPHQPPQQQPQGRQPPWPANRYPVPDPVTWSYVSGGSNSAPSPNIPKGEFRR